MHNHTEFCNAHYVKNADYIKFPFSASTVGPRVGAAALDMVGAALKVVNKRRVRDELQLRRRFLRPAGPRGPHEGAPLPASR